MNSGNHRLRRELSRTITQITQMKNQRKKATEVAETQRKTLKDMISRLDVQEFQFFFNSPLKRGDKGVCKIAATPPQPLFLEGESKSCCQRQPTL